MRLRGSSMHLSKNHALFLKYFQSKSLFSLWLGTRPWTRTRWTSLRVVRYAGIAPLYAPWRDMDTIIIRVINFIYDIYCTGFSFVIWGEIMGLPTDYFETFNPNLDMWFENRWLVTIYFLSHLLLQLKTNHFFFRVDLELWWKLNLNPYSDDAQSHRIFEPTVERLSRIQAIQYLPTLTNCHQLATARIIY